jgi:hypothetical protein
MARGLTAEEVAVRLAEHGPLRLREWAPLSLALACHLLLRQGVAMWFFGG